MAKYHINPATGEPGACRAQIKCRFGRGEDEHFESKDEARMAYEAERASFEAPAPTAMAMLAPFDKQVKKIAAKLHPTRYNDGSVFGSSGRSRFEDHWIKVRYLASSYVDKGEDWDARRGYYHQMRDHVLRMRDELGERSWGGVREEYRELNDRLGALYDKLDELCCPGGRQKEAELGLHQSAKPEAAPPAPRVPPATEVKSARHVHSWATVGARHNYEILQCACGAERKVYDE